MNAQAPSAPLYRPARRWRNRWGLGLLGLLLLAGVLLLAAQAVTSLPQLQWHFSSSEPFGNWGAEGPWAGLMAVLMGLAGLVLAFFVVAAVLGLLLPLILLLLAVVMGLPLLVLALMLTLLLSPLLLPLLGLWWLLS